MGGGPLTGSKRTIRSFDISKSWFNNRRDDKDARLPGGDDDGDGADT